MVGRIYVFNLMLFIGLFGYAMVKPQDQAPCQYTIEKWLDLPDSVLKAGTIIMLKNEGNPSLTYEVEDDQIYDGINIAKDQNADLLRETNLSLCHTISFFGRKVLTVKTWKTSVDIGLVDKARHAGVTEQYMPYVRSVGLLALACAALVYKFSSFFGLWA